MLWSAISNRNKTVIRHFSVLPFSPQSHVKIDQERHESNIKYVVLQDLAD